MTIIMMKVTVTIMIMSRSRVLGWVGLGFGWLGGSEMCGGALCWVVRCLVAVGW